MFYVHTITTPANTAESAKQKTKIALAKGIVHIVEIMFPPGSNQLLHIHINRGLHQTWPSNSEANFIGDNATISFREHYEITGRPYQMEVYTWNDDNTYDHTVIVRIGILPARQVLRRIG